MTKPTVTTVEILLAKLSAYPPQTRVVVNGYEGGYDDITTIQLRPIALHVNSQDYMGTHDDPDDAGQVTEQAVVLSGRNRLGENIGDEVSSENSAKKKGDK